MLPEWFPVEREEGGESRPPAEAPEGEGVSEEWVDVPGRDFAATPPPPVAPRVDLLPPKGLKPEDMARAVVLATVLGSPRGVAPYRPPPGR